MERTFTGIFVKPEVSMEKLKKYGFKGNYNYAYWKPHFNCLEYEKEYYNDNDDYMVFVQSGQIVIRPNGWTQLSGKIQTLLFDMFTDGIVEKRTISF